MPLAIFDLDNTLLAGDSDHAWGEFLAEHGLVDGENYRRENERYYAEYRAGTLDIYDFLAFALKPLAEHDLATLEAWRERYLAEKVRPMITEAARALVERHRAAGDTLVVITATNSFVTAPIARLFGIEHLIATEPEMRDGRYTGRVAGVPCFREGKVVRLEAWMARHGHSLAGSWFYSDSHNDLPLLTRVTHPVAVNPDETLRREAERRGWPILALH
jgi:HAD superfamily hydrolase (TIGR01490 family)